MDVIKLVKNLNDKLDKGFISSKILLSKFKLIDQSSRFSSAYNDSRYIPFYYYLGCEIKPRNIVEFGFRLGLSSGAFLMGCKSVENFLAFQAKEDDIFYSSRLGKSNIKNCYNGNFDIYVGSLIDKSFEDIFTLKKWDLLIINEELTYDIHMQYLNFAWEYMNIDGFIVVDYFNYNKPSGNACKDFCKANNRDCIVLDTKYGVGIIQK